MQWIESAEASGQITFPGCPFGRLEMTSEEIHSILDRPFQPRTTVVPSSATALAEMDELTLQWLQEQTQTCPGCGACIEKSREAAT